MDAQKFIKRVRHMRELQIEYFASDSNAELLARCQQAEGFVRADCKKYVGDARLGLLAQAAQKMLLAQAAYFKARSDQNIRIPERTQLYRTARKLETELDGLLPKVEKELSKLNAWVSEVAHE